MIILFSACPLKYYIFLKMSRNYLSPLKKRKEDIPLLISHFIDQFNKSHITSVSDEVLAILMRHDFSGNIRELENIIEYALILCHDGVIRVAHLPEHFRTKYDDKQLSELAGQSLAAIQKRAIEQALIRNNWKRMATARELNIDKGTLRRMIERLGISG